MKNPLVYLVGTHSDILPPSSLESMAPLISEVILPFKLLTEDIRVFFVSNETEENVPSLRLSPFSAVTHALRQNLEDELSRKSILPPEPTPKSFYYFESYLEECGVSNLEVIPPKDLARLSMCTNLFSPLTLTRRHLWLCKCQRKASLFILPSRCRGAPLSWKRTRGAANHTTHVVTELIGRHV